ncbi:peptide-binding protein [Pseudooceanicola sp. C21-150M6]|uniref:peptide-binding protein n=1 Tax=Pseudooceanicola sp. C21-150M6 TaxID=3434355 RepID=UPI003D7F8F5E
MPALYDVSGVDAADTLNVRSAANAEAEIIATLPYDAKDIEVVAVNDTGTWGRVNVGEKSGWTSLAFLSRQAGQEGGTFPNIGSCFGAEPFWSFARDAEGEDSWALSRPDEAGLLFVEQWRGAAAGRSDRFGVAVKAPKVRAQGIITYGACSDSMSDLVYGLGFDLFLTDDSGATQLVTGCCSLSQ